MFMCCWMLEPLGKIFPYLVLNICVQRKNNVFTGVVQAISKISIRAAFIFS